jgi:hypothetical protein
MKSKKLKKKFQKLSWKFLFIELCVCLIRAVVYWEIIFPAGREINENAQMRADLNIKFGLKKNAESENYFNLVKMKIEVIFYLQKICVR